MRAERSQGRPIARRDHSSADLPVLRRRPGKASAPRAGTSKPQAPPPPASSWTGGPETVGVQVAAGSVRMGVGVPVAAPVAVAVGVAAALGSGVGVPVGPGGGTTMERVLLLG